MGISRRRFLTFTGAGVLAAVLDLGEPFATARAAATTAP